MALLMKSHRTFMPGATRPPTHARSCGTPPTVVPFQSLSLVTSSLPFLQGHGLLICS